MDRVNGSHETCDGFTPISFASPGKCKSVYHLVLCLTSSSTGQDMSEAEKILKTS